MLNRRVVLHAIDATPARWRGDAGSSPLDRARTTASSPRNDLVKNCRVRPTHWLIYTQVTSLSQSLANDAAANPRAPKPVKVTFAPKRNVRYCSRFRFDVHHGESFDVVLQGAGSYEEDVLPRHVRVAGRNR